MKVRLHAKRSADARCAYCHDSLDGVLSSCPRCLTTFHRDCRAHLAQCPTLGCGTAFTSQPDLIVEPEAPAGLVDELLRERLPVILLGVVSAVLLAALTAMLPLTADVLVIAGFLVLGILWSIASIGREVGFYRALRPLMQRTPLRMTIEIRSEVRGEEQRVFVAQLMGPAGELLTLDLGSTLPAWVLAPGPAVDVFFAESGPVALRSLKGHVYAVPEGRVTRHV